MLTKNRAAGSCPKPASESAEAAKAAAGSEDYALVMVDQENNVWISGSLRGNFEPHETDADYTYIYID